MRPLLKATGKKMEKGEIALGTSGKTLKKEEHWHEKNMRHKLNSCYEVKKGSRDTQSAKKGE